MGKEADQLKFLNYFVQVQNLAEYKESIRLSFYREKYELQLPVS